MTNGDCKASASWTLSPEGGSFRLTSADPAAREVTLHADRGAVAMATTITVSLCKRMVAVHAGRASGLVVNIASPGVTSFQAPLRLEIEQAPGKMTLIVPYRLGDDGQLFSAQLLSLDRASGRFVIWTMLPGGYTWVFT